MRKIILRVLIVFALLALLVYLGLLFFFPDEKVRAYLQKEATTQLGQPVTIEALSVSFWGGLGITLDGILIGQGENKLAEIESVDIKMRFWPLLSGKYVVERLIVTKPEVKLVIAEDGSSSLSAATPDSAPVEAEGMAEAVLLLGGLSFGKLQIDDGGVHRINRQDGSALDIWGIDFDGALQEERSGNYVSAGEFLFDSLRQSSHLGTDSANSTTIPPLSLRYRANLEAETAKITLDTVLISVTDKAQLLITGEVTELDGNQNASLKYQLTGAELSDLLAFNQEVSGESIDLLKDAGGKLSVSGRIQIEDGELTDFDGAGAVKNLRVPAGFDTPEFYSATIGLGFNPNSAELYTDEISSGESKFALEIGLENFDDPAIKAKLNGDFSLGALAPYLPQAGDPALTGKAKTDLTVELALAKPELAKINGSVVISGGSLTASTLPENITSFSASCDISNERIELKDFNIVFESSDLSLNGTITDPFPYLLPLQVDSTDKSPYLTFTASGSRLDIDRLFPEATPGSEVNRGVLPPDSIPPLPIPQIKGEGTVTLDTLIYAEATFTNVSADVRINRSVIFCENVRGNVYGGALTGVTTIDLTEFTNPHYSGSFSANELSADEVVSRFSPWDGKAELLGKLKLSGNYDSYGWEPEDFISTLTMNLFSSGDSLVLRRSPIGQQLGASIAQLTGDNSYTTRFETLNLRSFVGAVQVVDGSILVNDFKGSDKNIGAWNITGAIGFDGSLNLSGSLAPIDQILSAATKKLNIPASAIDLLKNPKTGRAELPLLFGGTIDSPTVSLDQRKINDLIGKAIKDKAVNKLKSLFGK